MSARQVLAKVLARVDIDHSSIYLNEHHFNERTFRP
jgi:hypothetical protein